MTRWGRGLGGTTRRWRTVAVGPLPDPSSHPSIAVEDALGRDDGLVVVTGPSVRATAGVAERGMRRMLGDHALVRVVRPHEADLSAVIADAARHVPVVVHVPDAPPALLDQVDTAVRARVDDRVRLLITTRPAFLAATDEPAATILRSATIDLDGRDDGALDLDPRFAGRTRTAAAVVLTVADLDRLGLAGAVVHRPSILGPHGAPTGVLGTAASARSAWATALARVFGPGERSYAYRFRDRLAFWLSRLVEALAAALRASGDHLRLRRAIRSALRSGLLERRGRYLAPSSELVDRTADHLVPVELAVRLDKAEVLRAGRVADARGEEDLAATLLDRLAPDMVPREPAMRVGEWAERAGIPLLAVKWYCSVGRRGSDTLARRARRAAALLDLNRVELRVWLNEAGEDESDLEVQYALARRVVDPAEACRRYQLVAAGDDERALAAVEALATIVLSEGRDDEAEPLLRRLLSDPAHADRARLRLVRALRRLGRGAEADAEAALPVTDPEVAIALVRERAAIRRDRGDLDGAAELLRPVVGEILHRQALAAASELAVIEAERGDWDAVVAVFPTRPPSLPLRRLVPDPLLDVDTADCLAQGFSVLGEAAWRRGDRQRAGAIYEEVRKLGYGSARISLRLGELAIARGDLRGAENHLRAAAGSPDAAIAAEAERLLRDLAPALAQLQARELAAQQAAALEPHWA